MHLKKISILVSIIFENIKHMDNLINILVNIGFIWLYALLIIGPFQVIAAIIRALCMKDWNSNFGKKLKQYFKYLVGYFFSAGITYLINEYITEIGWIIVLFVPILCTAIAIYYWSALYLYYKEKKGDSLENN